MYMPVAVLLITGFSGLIAQLVFLREIGVTFSANEMIMGIVLSNWVLAEASGAYLFSRSFVKSADPWGALYLLQLFFSVLFPVFVCCTRFSHSLLGLGPGQAPGVWQVVWVSFLLLFPVSFAHGALFSCLARIVALSRVYAWESLGTMIAGLSFTYLSLVYLGTFELVLAVSLLNLILCAAIAVFRRKRFTWIAFSAAMILMFAGMMQKHAQLDLFSAARFFPGSELIERRNSALGVISVTRMGRQYTFYYNASPVVTAPDPHHEFIQETSHIPLLFHSAPEKILVIGTGAGGFLSELLAYQQARVTYLELDPVLVDAIRKYPAGPIMAEFSDARVEVRHQDGRYFLAKNPGMFDMVFINTPAPSELSLNRFFTDEFFALAKERLSRGGIITFCLPGSLSYLGQELKEVNASILAGLKKNYFFVKVIPGDYLLYMASSDVDFDTLRTQDIIDRMKERKVKAGVLSPEHLRYRLDRKWQEWFERSMEKKSAPPNRDLTPFAVFGMMRLWHRQFFNPADYWKLAVFFLSILACIVWMFVVCSPEKRLLGTVLATTGFYGMLMTVILLLSFQIFNGYLYKQMGAIISLFMAGASLGGFSVAGIKQSPGGLLGEMALAEGLIMLSIAAGAVVILVAGPALLGAAAVFYLLSLCAGFLVGWEFALAACLCAGSGSEKSRESGFLYASDLAGSYFAGIIGSVVFLPLWGVAGCFLALAAVKLFSFALLLFSGAKRRFFL